MYTERMLLLAEAQAARLSKTNIDPNAKLNIYEQLRFTAGSLASYYKEIADGTLSRIFVPGMADVVIMRPEIRRANLPFTDEAKKAIVEAGNDAVKLKHLPVGPEDLLLALIKQQREREVLNGFGITYENLLEAIQSQDGVGKVISTIEFSYSWAFTNTIEQAALESRKRNWTIPVGPIRLLWALMATRNEEEGVAKLIACAGTVDQKRPDRLYEKLDKEFRTLDEPHTGKV